MDARMQELQKIRELLKAALQKEGYEIPPQSYADRGYLAFDLPLKSPRVKNEKALIEIRFETFGE